MRRTAYRSAEQNAVAVKELSQNTVSSVKLFGQMAGNQACRMTETAVCIKPASGIHRGRSGPVFETAPIIKIF